MIPARPEQWIESPSPVHTEDLIPGLLPSRGHLLITGETEVGKTLIALEIAQSVLTGHKLWGLLTPTRTVEQVLYVLGEHDEEVVKGLWRKTGLMVPPHSLALIGPEHRHVLVARGLLSHHSQTVLTEWAKGCGLLIFDPLAAFVAGADVENDNVQMRTLINAMATIAKANQAALMILHHMGKPWRDWQTGQERHRETYASRGGSAIEDAVTACFYMERAGADQYKLIKRKYKGTAPSLYRLTRNPDTFCHSA